MRDLLTDLLTDRQTHRLIEMRETLTCGLMLEYSFAYEIKFILTCKNNMIMDSILEYRLDGPDLSAIACVESSLSSASFFRQEIFVHLCVSHSYLCSRMCPYVF